MARRMPLLLLALLGLPDMIAEARQRDAAALCHEAAARAAGETGVPLPILTAILLAESGRRETSGRLVPWPWTLHAEGRGLWFDTPAAAADKLAELVGTGLTNIDIGCFQINLHWHGNVFPSPEAMLDPLANARHAARFLTDLHAESGDWRVAAGQYHSRDPGRAETYVRRLETLHVSASTGAAEAPAPPAPQTGGVLIDLALRRPPLVGALP